MCGASAANAQVNFREWITPDRPIVDGRGVDVQLGEVNVTTEPVGVGDVASAASWSGITSFDKFRAYIAGTAASTTAKYVFLHGKSIKFIASGSGFVPENADGSTLVKSTSGPETWTYTSPDGSVYTFVRRYPEFQPDWSLIRAHLSTVTRPDGRNLTYYYNADYGDEICGHKVAALTAGSKASLSWETSVTDSWRLAGDKKNCEKR